jgi:hypothetical protein
MKTEWSLFYGLCSFFYPDFPTWPEFAIAVILPNAYRDGYAQPHSAANIISQRVFQAYFDLNEKGQPTTK